MREFADNAIEHITNMMGKLMHAGEPCELYDIHGHYAGKGRGARAGSWGVGPAAVPMLSTRSPACACISADGHETGCMAPRVFCADAGEAAALISFSVGADMVLTGHSLGRNKLEHLLKAGGWRLP